MVYVTGLFRAVEVLDPGRSAAALAGGVLVVGVWVPFVGGAGLLSVVVGLVGLASVATGLCGGFRAVFVDVVVRGLVPGAVRLVVWVGWVAARAGGGVALLVAVCGLGLVLVCSWSAFFLWLFFRWLVLFCVLRVSRLRRLRLG
nr:hypothetical protein [Kaistia granuli]